MVFIGLKDNDYMWLASIAIDREISVSDVISMLIKEKRGENNAENI